MKEDTAQEGNGEQGRRDFSNERSLSEGSLGAWELILEKWPRRLWAIAQEKQGEQTEVTPKTGSV